MGVIAKKCRADFLASLRNKVIAALENNSCVRLPELRTVGKNSVTIADVAEYLGKRNIYVRQIDGQTLAAASLEALGIVE